MNKKRSSMRFIISISFIVLMTITFGTIGYFVFSDWKASADNIVAIIEKDTNEGILNQMEDFVNEPLEINEVNRNLFEGQIVDLNNKEKREKFFVGVLKSSKEEVYSFSFGTENGEYYGARRNTKNEIEIMENNAETNGKTRYYSVTKEFTSGKLMEETAKFDPRKRDWYKIAKEKRKAAFSPIYKHFVMDDLAISAAYPIYNSNGTLRGVLGTHIVLSNINRYLKEIVQERRATAYIIDKASGELVANTLERPNFETVNNNQFKRLTIQEMDDLSITEAYQNYKNNSKNKTIVIKQNDRIHVAFTEFKKEGLDWLIITAIPESQFTSEIINSIRMGIALSIIALIIAIIIYIKSTDIILQPIYNLISTTEKFSKGDFLQRAKIYRNDEIGKLSGAFNNMAEQLHILINTLEEKVKERTIELEKANDALRQSEGNIRLLLDSTAEAIFGIDRNGKCTFCNASCLRMLKYKDQNELIGKNMHWQIHYKRSDGTPILLSECKILQALIKGEGTHVEDEVFWRADGTCFPVEYFSYPQYREGEIVGAVITFMDITERKKSEKEIIYLSYHDQLTGLYNRRYFEEELKRLDVPRNFPLTIVMADMNGLKLVNDSFGHAVGDELLKKVAEVIKKGCRSDDIVARLGGDEFVILLPKTGTYQTEQIIMRIKKIASAQKVGSVVLSISFGYGTKDHEEETIDEVLKKAEDQMYRNKLLESPSMRGKTISAIISTLHEKNKQEEAHSIRVSELCYSMGQALGLPAGDVEELKTAGLLHDIGKIALEERLLTKPGKLNDDEWEEIKRHSEIGYRILSTVNDLSEIAEYVLAHHERWDGKGYPKGLMKTEIPLQSRIIAIADAYDAMTNERRYRSQLSEEVALEELRNNAATQFDPGLIRVFIEQVLGKWDE